ncbi:nucleic acid-binding, OB-fold protein [Artemisia annua]|uniref:Nucleic acid-binding, OB-fold protein n=1 Tax=Artemisia annua TaxID=35608 RepID=A0A2U1NGK0_ARTAN|nr:nucleic acid-binding, OB-fold protein [Artemisia annua]
METVIEGMYNIGVNFIDQISTSKDSWKLKVRILLLWKQPFQLDMILMDKKDSWKLKVRILLLWKQPFQLDMILMDKKATIKKMLLPSFEMLLQEGSIIILSKFGIAENNGKHPVIKHQYKLNFYRNTIVKKSLDFQGPVFGFLFVSFDDILNNEAGFDFCVGEHFRLYFGSQPANDFSFYLLIIYVSTYVIGNVFECGDINVFSRNGKESKLISLQLENDELVMVLVDLLEREGVDGFLKVTGSGSGGGVF